VEVRLGTQVLLLARNGAVTRIVVASSGKASTPTPGGDYTVTRRIDGWRTSSLGELWRPNYFHAGYAIHGYTSVPSYPASHGCVRVPIPSMNRLRTAIGVGTPVHIYG
jgi:lipoprotein-anchoring transpeptidase ErfK/SrfK